MAAPSTIAFPEPSDFAVRKSPRNRRFSFQQLLAVVYIFGGLSASIALLSKFVMQPLFEQLSADRSDYTRLATSLLRQVNVKLSNMVSKIPPVPVVRGGPVYVDSQTQTESSDKLARELRLSSSEDKESGALPNADNLTEKLEKLEQKSKLEETTATKEAIDKLSTLTASLNYSVYSHRAGFGIDLGSAEKNKDKEKEKDVVGDVMKEIRSIKGSLLSARNFPGAR